MMIKIEHKKFYEDVFGWQINKFPEMDYHLVTTTPTDEKMKPTEPGAINGLCFQKILRGHIQ